MWEREKLLGYLVLVSCYYMYCCSYYWASVSGFQCRTGIKGPGRELFDGGPF